MRRRRREGEALWLRKPESDTCNGEKKVREREGGRETKRGSDGGDKAVEMPSVLLVSLNDMISALANFLPLREIIDFSWCQSWQKWVKSLICDCDRLRE